MQINLLSLFSGGGESTPSASSLLGENTAVNGEVNELGEGSAGFNQLFKGKLAELTPEQMQEMPVPKLMAAFLQRLTTLTPEAEMVAVSPLAPVVTELSQEQLVTLSQLLGIDASALELNAAISAEQILPQATADQQRVVSDLMLVLKEVANLGQKLHQQGLSLVEAKNPNDIEAGQGENLSTASILTLLANNEEIPQVQPLELSEETIAALATLFQLPEAEIRHNIAQIQLVDISQIDSLTFEGLPIVDIVAFSNDLEEQATAPGLVQLIASVLNKPVEEVWQQMESLTGEETEIPLGLVLASIIQPPQAEKTRDTVFDFSKVIPKQGDKIASLPLKSDSSFGDVPELAGRKVLGDLELPNISKPADAAVMASASPLKFAPNHRQAVSAENTQMASLAGVTQSTISRKANDTVPQKLDNLAPLPKADDAPNAPNIRPSSDKPEALPAERSRPLSAAVAQSREATARSAAPLRENSIAPLLRESAERPLAKQVPVDSTSSLALSASDSKLDFDAKMREARSANNRPAANPNNVREQVAVQVKQGIARGDSQINVRLHPAELGRVDVRMEVQADGRTTVAIVADSRDTLEMLQRDSRSLEKAFADLGMEMSDSGMSFDLNEQFAGDQEGDSPKDNAKSASDSFDAILANPDEMIAEALLDGGPLSYSVGVDDGLNIKV